MLRLPIQGVIPPMVTPFTKSGQLDLDAHDDNIQQWNAAGLGGYLVLGSNSEAAYLTEKEKLQLIGRTAEKANAEHLVLAGTGMESTRETIHLTNEGARAGADAALLITPFYYKEQMTDQALIHHFKRVADAARIPILIYNVTKYTGINISPAVIGELSRHPNIIGMKDSSGSIPQLISFQKAAAEGFNVLVGTASAWYPGLVLGVKAGIMALANCAPAECVRVQQLYDLGKWKDAEGLYRSLFPVNQAVTATYGIAGLKYASSQRGIKGGYVRSPLMELTKAQKSQLDEILAEAGLSK